MLNFKTCTQPHFTADSAILATDGGHHSSFSKGVPHFKLAAAAVSSLILHTISLVLI